MEKLTCLSPISHASTLLFYLLDLGEYRKVVILNLPPFCRLSDISIHLRFTEHMASPRSRGSAEMLSTSPFTMYHYFFCFNSWASFQLLCPVFSILTLRYMWLSTLLTMTIFAAIAGEAAGCFVHVFIGLFWQGLCL